MNIRGIWPVAALLLAAGGCVSTPVRPAPPLMTPVLTAPETVQRQRAEAFRKLTDDVPVRGVGIFLNAVNGRIATSALFDRVQNLGFNRIYCYVSSEVQLDDFFREFVSAASRRGIPVEVVLNQRDFYSRPTANRVVRFFRPSYPRLDEAARLVAKFNATLPEGTRLAGLTVIVEPHRFTATNPDIPPDSLYYWSEKTFGAGLDNAMLMEDALRLLRQISKTDAKLPLTIGVADFYHELATEGKLPLGKVADFCAVSPRLMLLDYGNKPGAAANAVENELAAMPAGSVALVGINLAGHTSVDAGALRRRDWNDLLRGMKHVLGRFEKHRSFGGFVLAPLSAMEFMRAECD